jgi:competence protein ComEC
VRHDDVPPAAGVDEDEADRPRDLRMPLVAAVAWAGALVGAWVDRVPAGALPVVLVLVLGSAGAAVVVVGALRGSGARRSRWRTAGALGGVLLVLATSSALRSEQVSSGPVADLAAERAAVTVLATVTSDPRVVTGRFGDQRLVRVTAREVVGRGHRWRVRSPVLVIGDPDEVGAAVRLGARVRLTGRLGPARDGDVAAILSPSSATRRVADPGPAWRAADHVRASIRASVAHRPAAQAALVPALVDGDDAAVEESLADDFRTTGLTHLLTAQDTPRRMDR